MGNLASCVSKKVEKDGLDLMQTLFHEMEKRLMDCIKAELTQSRSQGSNVSGADIEYKLVVESIIELYILEIIQ